MINLTDKEAHYLKKLLNAEVNRNNNTITDAIDKVGRADFPQYTQGLVESYERKYGGRVELAESILKKLGKA